MASSGSLGASASAFLKALCAIKRRAGTDIMALQAGSAATEATWATRTFSSWARQRLSLSCVAMLGRGVQNIRSSMADVCFVWGQSLGFRSVAMNTFFSGAFNF